MSMCSAPNCKKAVKEEDSIQCPCERWWHIDCVPGMTRTTAYIVKKYNNIKFMCDDCVTVMDSMMKRIDSLFDHLQQHDVEFDRQNQLLANIEKTVNKMSKQKEESDVQIIEQIEKVVKNSTKPTYAQKVKSNLQETVLIIQPKKDQESSETQKEIKSKIDPANVEVSSIRNISKGAVALGCKTKEAVAKLQQVVTERLGDSYELKIPVGLNPQIKIVGLSEKWSEIELATKLRAQNIIFENCETLKVCKIEVTKARTDRFNAIIEVGGKNFDQIMKMERMNVGWDRCRFFENMNVRRCFNCKGYNHKADDCKNKKACAKCAEDHDTKDCKNATEKCINCILANKNLNLNLNVNHCAWSKLCKVYKRRENDKKRKINYSE
jgi:hypothetical protein